MNISDLQEKLSDPLVTKKENGNQGYLSKEIAAFKLDLCILASSLQKVSNSLKEVTLNNNSENDVIIKKEDIDPNELVDFVGSNWKDLSTSTRSHIDISKKLIRHLESIISKLPSNPKERIKVNFEKELENELILLKIKTKIKRKAEKIKKFDRNSQKTSMEKMLNEYHRTYRSFTLNLDNKLKDLEDSVRASKRNKSAINSKKQYILDAFCRDNFRAKQDPKDNSELTDQKDLKSLIVSSKGIDDAKAIKKDYVFRENDKIEASAEWISEFDDCPSEYSQTFKKSLEAKKYESSLEKVLFEQISKLQYQKSKEEEKHKLEQINISNIAIQEQQDSLLSSHPILDINMADINISNRLITTREMKNDNNAKDSSDKTDIGNNKANDTSIKKKPDSIQFANPNNNYPYPLLKREKPSPNRDKFDKKEKILDDKIKNSLPINKIKKIKKKLKESTNQNLGKCKTINNPNQKIWNSNSSIEKNEENKNVLSNNGRAIPKVIKSLKIQSKAIIHDEKTNQKIKIIKSLNKSFLVPNSSNNICERFKGEKNNLNAITQLDNGIEKKYEDKLK